LRRALLISAPFDRLISPNFVCRHDGSFGGLLEGRSSPLADVGEASPSFPATQSPFPCISHGTRQMSGCRPDSEKMRCHCYMPMPSDLCLAKWKQQQHRLPLVYGRDEYPQKRCHP
jgi:hypothetical protein